MAKNITVYSTPTCPFCIKVKEFLKEKKVKYKEINVAEDRKALDEMVEKSGQMGVPVVEIDGKIIVGFDEKALEKAMA